MQRFGERFDHNLHALRIVESFEQRYARFPGLNLTFEVREGIVKHSRDFAPGEKPELDEYLPGLRPPLEAQLIDLADEMAYNTADLDDAFSAGLFTGRRRGRRRAAISRDSRSHGNAVPRRHGARALSRSAAPVDRHAGVRPDRGHRRCAPQPAAWQMPRRCAPCPARLAAFTPEAGRNQPRAEAVPVSRGLRLGRPGQRPAALHGHDRRAVPLLPRAARTGCPSLMRSRPSTNPPTAWSAITSPA